MSDQIPVAGFRASLLALLDETFTSTKGIYLDLGTSMFETLATVSAAEASRPVGGGCASLAAQVNHTASYLDVAQQYAGGNPPEEPVDWDASWNVRAVDDEEWKALIQKLHDAFDATRSFAVTYDNWNADFIGGAFGIVAHCAYHLGEIRQALCIIKGDRTKAA